MKKTMPFTVWNSMISVINPKDDPARETNEYEIFIPIQS